MSGVEVEGMDLERWEVWVVGGRGDAKGAVAIAVPEVFATDAGSLGVLFGRPWRELEDAGELLGIDPLTSSACLCGDGHGRCVEARMNVVGSER